MVNGLGARVELCQIAAQDDIGCTSVGTADAYPHMCNKLAVGTAWSGIDLEPFKIALH
ncbi:hypothetical protein BRPE67_ECDS02640 (plasmid) [Caballeronia cordobensis]|nr:hypothetical protein BRPE67_ECDS02640 [Burkholderia sp. RPE67]